MDFDKLLITHKELSTKMDLNAQLKFWTINLFCGTYKGTLKVLCLSILFISIVKIFSFTLRIWD